MKSDFVYHLCDNIDCLCLKFDCGYFYHLIVDVNNRGLLRVNFHIIEETVCDKQVHILAYVTDKDALIESLSKPVLWWKLIESREHLINLFLMCRTIDSFTCRAKHHPIGLSPSDLTFCSKDCSEFFKHFYYSVSSPAFQKLYISEIVSKRRYA